MHINLKLGKAINKAVPADNDGSAEDNNSKHDDAEVDNNSRTPTKMPMMKRRAPLKGLSGHRRQIIGLACSTMQLKNKQGANTNTSASANFSVSGLFSLTSSDAAVKMYPM